MRNRRYLVYDVFTDTPFAGNPLAIVLDCDGLDGAAMQRIANEFNLSETVFVLSQDIAAGPVPIRIFTPKHELPFAGHPTVGTAVALADLLPEDGSDRILMLHEKVGSVRCVVSRGQDVTFAEFDLPRLPAPFPFGATRGLVAAALGLSPTEIGFENHVVGAWSGGVPYVLVPVADLDSAGRARLDDKLWTDLVGSAVEADTPAIYVYCRGGVLPGSSFHARMFAPHLGLVEDPATGSAVAAFAGAVVAFDGPQNGTATHWIEQGVEMGRPSRIRLELETAGASITRARIGGHAVKIAEGVLVV